MAVLDRELYAADIVAIPALGSSFDGTHCEESRAVFGLDDSSACQLGQRFGQVAASYRQSYNAPLLIAVANPAPAESGQSSATPRPRPHIGLDRPASAVRSLIDTHPQSEAVVDTVELPG